MVPSLLNNSLSEKVNPSLLLFPKELFQPKVSVRPVLLNLCLKIKLFEKVNPSLEFLFVDLLVEARYFPIKSSEFTKEVSSL